MKSNKDSTIQKKQSQFVRYVLICILVVAVGIALMVQNNWMKQTSEPLQTQTPLLAVREVEDGVKVTLTTLKEKQPYLVEYNVDPHTYSFTADTYKELNKPIQEIRYSQGGELWVKRDSEWSLLDEDLKPSSTSTTGPTRDDESSPSIKEVTKVGATFQTTVKDSNGSEWSNTFLKRPLEVEELGHHGDVWVVLLEGFEIKIVKN